MTEPTTYSVQELLRLRKMRSRTQYTEAVIARQQEIDQTAAPLTYQGYDVERQQAIASTDGGTVYVPVVTNGAIATGTSVVGSGGVIDGRPRVVREQPTPRWRQNWTVATLFQVNTTTTERVSRAEPTLGVFRETNFWLQLNNQPPIKIADRLSRFAADALGVAAPTNQQAQQEWSLLTIADDGAVVVQIVARHVVYRDYFGVYATDPASKDKSELFLHTFIVQNQRVRVQHQQKITQNKGDRVTNYFEQTEVTAILRQRWENDPPLVDIYESSRRYASNPDLDRFDDLTYPGSMQRYRRYLLQGKALDECYLAATVGYANEGQIVPWAWSIPAYAPLKNARSWQQVQPIGRSFYGLINEPDNPNARIGAEFSVSDRVRAEGFIPKSVRLSLPEPTLADGLGWADLVSGMLSDFYGFPQHTGTIGRSIPQQKLDFYSAFAEYGLEADSLIAIEASGLEYAHSYEYAPGITTAEILPLTTLGTLLEASPDTHFGNDSARRFTSFVHSSLKTSTADPAIYDQIDFAVVTTKAAYQ